MCHSCLCGVKRTISVYIKINFKLISLRRRGFNKSPSLADIGQTNAISCDCSVNRDLYGKLNHEVCLLGGTGVVHSNNARLRGVVSPAGI